LKSKKIFAIVTLLVFMMTLLPMAAFANADRFASVASINKTSLPANGSDAATITIYTYGANNSVYGGGYVYFASSRTTEVFAGDTGTFDGELQYVITDATTGMAKIKVSSGVPGSAKIALGTPEGGKTVIADYLYGGSGAPSAETAKIFQNGTFDITFTAPSAKKFVIAAIDKNGGLGFGTSASPYSDTGVKGNSVDYFEVSFKLQADNGAPVRDTAVEFSANKTDVSFSATTVTSDAAGVAKVKVFAAKPGTYTVKAKAGDVEKEIYLKYGTNALYSVELISDQNQVIAKNADKEFKFKLFDVNGNQIQVSGILAGAKHGQDVANSTINLADLQLGLKFEAMKKPADCALDEKIFNSSTPGDYTFYTEDATGYLIMKIFSKELDTEGDYSIKAYFDTGKSATVNFTVKKQGTPTKLTVDYKPSIVAIGSAVAAPTVKQWDDAGVSKQVTTNLEFVASDTRAIVGLNNATGAFNTIGVDEKYAGEKTITVIDKDKKLTAVATITVTKWKLGQNNNIYKEV